VDVTGRDAEPLLADLVAAFSLATDLGLGQPLEHVLRSWQIAVRLGEIDGLDADERAALFYVATLSWVGCVADTPEVAAWFGDDIAYRADSYAADLGGGAQALGFMLRHVGTGAPLLHRLRLGATMLGTGARGIERGIMSHCVTTGHMAERLGLGTDVQTSLQQVFARWDGKGVPDGVGGDDISRPMRLFHLAEIVEVFHRGGGVAAAIAVARERRGGHFDPRIVDQFCGAAPDVLGDPADAPDWLALTAAEPGLQRRVAGDELDAVLEAMADFTDLRSPSRAGHSRGVAALAHRAAELAGLPVDEATTLRRAALLHDVGMHGVPSTILEKPGPLSATEVERVRMHAYYTDRVLARSISLAKLGAVAAQAHERADGSGYHRALKGSATPLAGRLLGAADAFHAMTEPRPYRPPLTGAQAAAELRADVRAGRLDAEAVDAVLSAAGQRTGKRRAGPAGLTPREIEVLLLISRGASNRQVARALGITVKTAGTHIERIYAKTGATTRSMATLFAMQQGLLDSLEPLDL
jgi:HD-GYP domain-containing protein (c-di-GMP phosphodiesterase class II)